MDGVEERVLAPIADYEDKELLAEFEASERGSKYYELLKAELLRRMESRTY